MLKELFKPHRLQQMYALVHQILLAAYGLSFVLIAIRQMELTQAGRWFVFISVISIADMITCGLLQTIVIKDAAKFTSKESEQIKIGSSAFIPGLMVHLGIIVLAFLLLTLFYCIGFHSEVLVDFVTYYPLMGLLSLLYNVQAWINIGRSNFKKVLIQRIVLIVTTILFLFLYYYFNRSIGFSIAIISQMIGLIVSNLFVFFFFHDNRLSFKNYDKATMIRYIGYGKYNFVTLLCSSLLRNADLFMIAGFLGKSSVAVYSLAQKAVEVFEVFLRAVAISALPELQRVHDAGNGFKIKLMKYIIGILLLFVPGAALVFHYSSDIIGLISGSKNYQLSSTICRIFMIYVLLIPIDRLLGVALEALNLAYYNLLKSILLAVINIAGNFIALYYFKSLELVAATSSVALIFAITAGYLLLKFSGKFSFDTKMEMNISMS